jgi:hypothetical protein
MTISATNSNHLRLSLARQCEQSRELCCTGIRAAGFAECLDNGHGCQIAEEHDGIEQIRPDSVCPCNARERTESNFDVLKVLETLDSKLGQH